MHATSISQLEETIRQKKAVINKLDQNLLEELAKQKLLEELLEDMVSSSISSNRSKVTLSQNSMVSSNCSGMSFDTDYVNEQIEKVKGFMKQLQQTSHYPQLPHFVDPKQVLLSKKKSLQRKNYVEPAIVKKQTQTDVRNEQRHRQTIIKQVEKSDEGSFELKQLGEQQIKVYLFHQETIQKQSKRPMQLQQLLTLKQTLRSESLREERQIIRKQLIEEQRNKQATGLTSHLKSTLKKTLRSAAQQPLINSSTLKAQRNIQFKGILKACGRAHRKAEVLQQKIRNYSFYR